VVNGGKANSPWRGLAVAPSLCIMALVLHPLSPAVHSWKKDQGAGSDSCSSERWCSWHDVGVRGSRGAALGVPTGIGNALLLLMERLPRGRQAKPAGAGAGVWEK